MKYQIAVFVENVVDIAEVNKAVKTCPLTTSRFVVLPAQHPKMQEWVDKQAPRPCKTIFVPQSVAVAHEMAMQEADALLVVRQRGSKAFSKYADWAARQQKIVYIYEVSV